MPKKLKQFNKAFLPLLQRLSKKCRYFPGLTHIFQYRSHGLFSHPLRSSTPLDLPKSHSFSSVLAQYSELTSSYTFYRRHFSHTDYILLSTKNKTKTSLPPKTGTAPNCNTDASKFYATELPPADSHALQSTNRRSVSISPEDPVADLHPAMIVTSPRPRSGGGLHSFLDSYDNFYYRHTSSAIAEVSPYQRVPPMSTSLYNTNQIPMNTPSPWQSWLMTSYKENTRWMGFHTRINSH